MATSSFALSHASSVQSYFHNLARAARSFGAALFAATPRSPEVRISASRDNLKLLELELAQDRAAVADMLRHAAAADMLHSVAYQFDATQPSQAAELHWLASRG